MKKNKIKRLLLTFVPSSILITTFFSSSCETSYQKHKREIEKEFLNNFTKVQDDLYSSFKNLRKIMIETKELSFENFYKVIYQKINNVFSMEKIKSFFDVFIDLNNIDKENIYDENHLIISKTEEISSIWTNFLNWFDKAKGTSQILIDKEKFRLLSLNEEIKKIFADYKTELRDNERYSLNWLEFHACFKNNEKWSSKWYDAENILFDNFSNNDKTKLRQLYFTLVDSYIKSSIDVIEKHYWNKKINNIDYDNLYDENNGHNHAIYNLCKEWVHIISGANNKFLKINSFLETFKNKLVFHDKPIYIKITDNKNSQEKYTNLYELFSNFYDSWIKTDFFGDNLNKFVSFVKEKYDKFKIFYEKSINDLITEINNLDEIIKDFVQN